MDDRTLTQLLDALDAERLADETLVVFTSDHGEAFQEHGRFLHDDLYPETLRVPLVLRLPHRLPAGRRVAEPVGLVDLVPTVLDLLALPPLRQAQGTSVAGLARGDAGAPAPPAVLADYTTAGHRFEGIRRDGLALVVDGPGRDRVRSHGRSGRAFAAAADRSSRGDGAPRRARPLACARTPRSRRGSDRAPATVAVPSADTVRQLKALGYVE
jgi:arylsulfatase A-like enzyme